MASLNFRRALLCALPSIAFIALTIGPAAAGTDVFGSGTGGIGSHGTSMTSSSYDKSGWGITSLKTYTPPAPEPYEGSELPSENFATPGNTSIGSLGGNGFGSNALYSGLSGDDFGGALAPLDQR